MEKIIYHKMSAVEDNHWWFRGRRALVGQILSGLHLPNGAAIFEVGCGTGGNFPMLAKYGRLYAMELDEAARAFASQRGLAQVLPGRLPDEIPMPGWLFDLIFMTDVLEHVEEDELSLRNLYACLNPGGFILVTVPAFQVLWSRHDELHHHWRRYTRERLCRIFVKAGYAILFASYFNTILFPLVAMARLGERLIPSRAIDDLNVPSARLNELLFRVFSSERHLIRNRPLPIGISILLLAQKS